MTVRDAGQFVQAPARNFTQSAVMRQHMVEQIFVQIQFHQSLQAAVDLEKVQTLTIGRNPIFGLHLFNLCRQCCTAHHPYPYAKLGSGEITPIRLFIPRPKPGIYSLSLLGTGCCKSPNAKCSVRPESQAPRY